jgi:hypothetical protein
VEGTVATTSLESAVDGSVDESITVYLKGIWWKGGRVEGSHDNVETVE